MGSSHRPVWAGSLSPLALVIVTSQRGRNGEPESRSGPGFRPQELPKQRLFLVLFSARFSSGLSSRPGLRSEHTGVPALLLLSEGAHPRHWPSFIYTAPGDWRSSQEALHFKVKMLKYQTISYTQHRKQQEGRTPDQPSEVGFPVRTKLCECEGPCRFQSAG